MKTSKPQSAWQSATSRAALFRRSKPRSLRACAVGRPRRTPAQPSPVSAVRRYPTTDGQRPPNVTTFWVQSALPALAELTVLYFNFVTVARLERNPTIKDEIQARGFGCDIAAGFLCYPAAQAADITAFKATVVPVGADQAPTIAQATEIVRRINRQSRPRHATRGARAHPCRRAPRRVDGLAKTSKSQGKPSSCPPRTRRSRLPCIGCTLIPTTCGRAIQAGWRAMSCSPTSWSKASPSERVKAPGAGDLLSERL